MRRRLAKRWKAPAAAQQRNPLPADHASNRTDTKAQPPAEEIGTDAGDGALALSADCDRTGGDEPGEYPADFCDWHAGYF